VTRNTETTDALVVNLSSNDPGEAAVASTVTIPAGQAAADFIITGATDGVVDGDQTATITASATDYVSGSDSITVLDADVATLTLTIDAAEVAEDGVVTASVSRNTDTSTALTVGLVSSDVGEAVVSSSVVIPVGATSVSFMVSGVTDGVVDGTQLVTVTASASSFLDSSDQIDVLDIDSEQTDILYFSRKNNGSVVGLTFQNEDIVAYDGTDFRVVFDGTPWVSGSTLDAFRILENGEILMSFRTAGSVTGGSLSFDDSDIVKFVPDTQSWEIYLDGSDVGLSSNGEDIDSISFAPDGRLVVSTSGSSSANGVSSRDEDLIVFNATSFGDNTSGSFEMYFDGSDVGLDTSSGEDIDAVSVTDDGAIYMSTVGNFSVSGISGADEDVFVFDPASLGSGTAGSFRTDLFFNGSDFGFANDMGGLQVVTPAEGGGGAAGDALMVISYEVESIAAEVSDAKASNATEVSSTAEVMGPLTQAQWEFMVAGEMVDWSGQMEQVSPASDESSENETQLFCLDSVFADWGI